jgi:hypothetical protein
MTTSKQDVNAFEKHAAALDNNIYKKEKFLNIDGVDMLLLPSEAREAMAAQIKQHSDHPDVTARQVACLAEHRALMGDEANHELLSAVKATKYAKQHNLTGELPKHASELGKVTPTHLLVVDAEIAKCADKRRLSDLTKLQGNIEHRLYDKKINWSAVLKEVREQLRVRNLVRLPYRAARFVYKAVKESREERLLTKLDKSTPSASVSSAPALSGQEKYRKENKEFHSYLEGVKELYTEKQKQEQATATGAKPVAAMGNNQAQQGYDDIMARMARVRAKNASPAVSPVKDRGKSM